MKLTTKQEQALNILTKNDNILLYGGARSGKTFLVCYYIVFRALTFARSRQLIARKFMTDVHASIWTDTLPTVLRLLGLKQGTHYKANNSLCQISFSNGSNIILAGLDDKERVDKILGQEFSTIYINESQDIPWTTIKTLMTRLSQKVGCDIKFICDLNPTSTIHWTYKLFIQGVNPESLLKQTGSTYGFIQMNPHDNKENLVAGYIEKQLENLTGSYRNRFLLGEYSTNSDLKVFNPPDYYDWQEFITWVNGRWDQMKYVAGLDLGFQDADAHVILGYINGCADVWLLKESKQRRQKLEDLAKTILEDRNWLRANCQNVQEISTYCDTITVRHGREGDQKKNWSELSRLYGIDNLRPAFKRDKSVGVEILIDDINSGRLHVPRNGPFADEIEKTVWRKNINEEIERIIDDEIFHPDLLDAILYPYRFLCSYGNDAMKGREKIAHKNDKKTHNDEFEEVQQNLDSILNLDLSKMMNDTLEY